MSGVAIMGDLNKDALRKMDDGYYLSALLSKFAAATERVVLEYIRYPWTCQSHGKFSNDGVAAARSCLNHTYVSGVFGSVHVLDDATTDHKPLVLDIKSAAVGGTSNAASKKILRRNLKNLSRVKLEAALNLTDWFRAHVIKDVNNVHAFIVAGIVKAMDRVAPLEAMQVKTERDLYLSHNTLDIIMKRGDDRTAGSNDYRSLRNRCNVLVAGDKRSSNSRELARSMGDPKRLWLIANQALGKNRPNLPDSLRKDDRRNQHLQQQQGG
jgi:hypothetical protein